MEDGNKDKCENDCREGKEDGNGEGWRCIIHLMALIFWIGVIFNQQRNNYN